MQAFSKLRARMWTSRAYRRLRANGATVGEGLRFSGRLLPIVASQGKMEIGKSLALLSTAVPVQLGTGPKGELRIGDWCLLNSGVNIYASESVVIGSFTLIADMVTIYDTDFHEVEAGAGVGHGPVVIGERVWLANGVTVLRGVTIGNNSVVGTGAVVTSSIPPNSLAVGNPARVVRTLKEPPPKWWR